MEERIISNQNRPSIPIGGHPVETGDYIIDTIAINEILEPMRHWIQMRVPGGIIYGAPRLGKTRAIKYIQNIFEYKYPNQWLNLRIKTRKRKTPNEDAFFEFFLKDVGHDLYSQGKAVAKRNRLSNFLMDKGDQTIRKQIVLFIDDAQRLTDIEFEWLMDIYNELDSFGITLTTILVGQNELTHRRSTYLTTAKQIVGRFMVHEERFYGVREMDELSYMLSSYDEITEFPVGSNCSYTNFFFPNGFNKGFRLENEAEYIWSSLLELRAENGINKKVEVPMHYLISIVNHVLLEYGANNVDNIDWPTKTLWKEAIKVSGFIHAEVLQS
ncbi:ATP-binding protein [Sutcliffiella horikoshii]|uniref:ATP-binding protein n=1 Tax=Sutcliffiella TaxID=2837511 RepID=UPI001CD3D032|nr:ATP-binding protein [Bacillus tianshenii]MCA1319375.1 ATP-binding protein [Bacillus tianshenii]